MITIRKPMPTQDVTKVSVLMLHGFRERGRRPVDFESATFSISSESWSSSATAESPISRREADKE
jgi:hypothetical protein